MSADKKKYSNIASNINFAEIEKQIIQFWQKNDIFSQSVEMHSGDDGDVEDVQNRKEYVFYDGPPFANGLPHYGHLLTGYVKDVYARYKTSKGKRVERKFGWDCHGLPAEMGAEKELGISGRLAISDFGIAKFNNHCRQSVMQFSEKWQEYVTRQARFVDFENSYKTMDRDFMESVLWAFKELYKKGLVYQSMRVMPYSWACETPLSNFETRLDNSYRERADKAVTVGFKLHEKPAFAPDGYKEYRMLAWTTTPWTLPSNLALVVGDDIEYVAVPNEEKGICYIIGKFAVGPYAKELGHEDGQEYKSGLGKDLVGNSYEPIFDYFKNHPNGFQVLSADFVVEGDGTGIVHTAPGFGEDDQILCEDNGIELVCPVDNAGKFTDEVKDLSGIHVLESNDQVIIKLKEQSLWFKTEQYLHNYPHCWRTDTPLIYKAVPSWYVKVTEFKDRMVELNQQINWIPGHVKDGLFGKWLENARDWSISRNRFWGTPIPIWMSDDPKYPRIDVYGSIEELEKDFGVKVEDLHRPFIDNLTRPNPDDPTGKSVMNRVEDVFDCWFESGSMPYGQVHYPFENKEWFHNHFPADFIVEYSAQTRGWFYTLMVLSTALFDRPPFLNCISHGVILDSTGQKLSKRLNNYADPLETFEQYGSDALRYVMLSSGVVKGSELLIDKDGKMVYDALRLHIKPIWNAYHFFTLYANSDSVEARRISSSENKLDQYILSKLAMAVKAIDQHLDAYDTQFAYQEVSGFFEILNNWYIRRSRQRFWKEEKDQDKQMAYNSLYTCLITMSEAISSLLPLVSEAIYRGLHGHLNDTEQAQLSVHLQPFPLVDNIKVNPSLVHLMDRVLEVCNAGLFVRNSQNIRVRQPLSSIKIIMKDAEQMTEFSELIEDELNVKNVDYLEDVESYADLKLAISFPIVGKRIPSKIKDIVAANKKGEWQIKDSKLEIAGEILENNEYELKLLPRDKNGSAAMASNDGIVSFDLEITEDLKNEGIARDVIRIVQQARKDAGFDIADRINLFVESKDDDVAVAVDKFADLIAEQTLAKIHNDKISGFEAEAKIQNNMVKVIVSKQ